MYKERRKLTFTKLEKISRTSDIPASLFQEDIFLNHLAHPENVSLNIISLYELDGCDNERLFCEAFDEVTVRHESLRTCFKLRDDKVFQIITPANKFAHPLTVTDISSLSQNEQKVYLHKYIHEVGYAPFDLRQCPLFRTKLFKTGCRRYTLFRSVHHSIIDLTSMNMFCDEVSKLYEAKEMNRNAFVEEPKFHFADYSAWERKNITAESLKNQFNYWRDVYKNPPDLINLPIDFERPQVLRQNFRNATQELSSAAWQQVKTLAQSMEVSLFQSNMALFAIFLNRYCSENDFYIGSSIDQRRARGLHGLFGPLISEFAVRCRFSDSTTCTDVMKEVKFNSINGYKNSDLSFEQLISASGLTRKLNAYTLYQVEFSLKPLVQTPNKLTFKELFWESGTGDVDLSCRIEEKKDGAMVVFRYNGDLFLESTVNKMLTTFVSLYEDIAANPNRKVIDLKNFNNSVRTHKTTTTADDSKPHVFHPVDNFEETVVAIWKNVLNLKDINSNLDFFMLGGTLQKLVNVYYQLNAKGFDISLSELYQYPTISGLGDYFRHSRPTKPKAA